METKKLKLLTIVIIFFLGSFAFVTPGVSYNPEKDGCWWCKPKIPSEEEMFSWVEDLWEIGIQGRYGYRMPGTAADWEGAEYVLQKFKQAGLKDTFKEPVPAIVNFPDAWSLTINPGVDDEDIPCYFLRYTAFTPPGGITKDMVYVGTGSDAEFNALNETIGIEDKIVLVDILAAPWPYTGFLDNYVLFEYDPEDTIGPGEMATENWPLANLDSSYQLADTYGAAGFIGIMTCMPDYVNQYLHWYANGELPGLTISPNDGEHLKDLLAMGPVQVKMVLTGIEEPGLTYNVYGFLPGKTDDVIVILTHHDGWATNEASGTSVVIALAKYFARIYKREKTLLFVSLASHFGKRAAWDTYDCKVYDLLPKVACAINIEMISKQIKVIGGDFVETGLVAPRGMFLSGPFMSANEHLFSYASEAIVKNDMERTFILPGDFAVPGEGGPFHALGIPTINYISHNPPQFTKYDTPDTVAKEELVPTTKMFIDIIKDLDVTPAALLKWVKTVDERGVKAYPDLRETIWQVNRPPYGPYDIIGLHRLVKEGIEPEGVVFMLPGTWSNGEQLTSNPPGDWWTHDEDHSFGFFLANRNFDVYAIDYRTHFVNPLLEPEDLSFMADWGWDQWISDIKLAVDLAKEISGVKKIFLAGDSFGGSAAMNYASMYWEEDLKGILLRDGGTGAKYPDLVDNEYNLPAMIAYIKSTGNWYSEVGGTPGSIFIMQFADKYPDAPPYYPGTTTPLEPQENPLTPEYDPWANISEWAAFMLYMAWGAGAVTNIYEGYGDPKVMIHIDATFDRYWPTRLSLESAAISDWDNCPYVTYDFDDHYHEIDVPLLGFTSELFGLAYWGAFIHWIANPDFTGYYLEGFGHLDVYSGEYSKEKVSEPTYEWLMSHRMLEGYGKLSMDSYRKFGISTIFINENFIDFKIGDVRVSWEIYYHKSWDDRECYKGKGDLGKISIYINKENNYAMVYGRNAFFFGSLV
ncbi:MAG: hypothetical protein ACFE8T_09665 [Promethearchaeota archaeon]